MKLAAFAVAALAAWGPYLARADEAPPQEPSVTVLSPGPAVPPSPPPTSTAAPAPTAESPSERGLAVSPALAPATLGFGQDPPMSRRSLAPAPAPTGPRPEAGLAVSQIFIGSLATFFTGAIVTLAAVGTHSAPVAYVGFAATPAVGALVVCRLGQDSKQYAGACAPSILGGYLGAIALAIPMWYVGSALYAPRIDSDSSETSPEVGAVLGAALGVFVGAAVGATIAWHVSKHRREQPARVTIGPPLPPPAALTAWVEVGARSTAVRAPTAVGVPLLSLRF